MLGRSTGVLGVMGRFGPRRWLRRLWLASLVSALWANRRDVTRWVGFASNAVRERDRRPMSDVLTEAKVRMAVSSDPLMRRDATLDDLRVTDGVLTLATTTAEWPDPRDQMVKLQQVKGISEVTTTMVTHGADTANGSARRSRTSLREALDARSGRNSTGDTSSVRHDVAGRR